MTMIVARIKDEARMWSLDRANFLSNVIILGE
jgi:hypothetical protein